MAHILIWGQGIAHMDAFIVIIQFVACMINHNDIAFNFQQTIEPRRLHN